MGFVCCCCCCCFLLCVGRHVVLQLLETAARWQRASVSPFRMIHRIGIRQPVATKKRGRIYERNTTTEWNTHTHTQEKKNNKRQNPFSCPTTTTTTRCSAAIGRTRPADGDRSSLKSHDAKISITFQSSFFCVCAPSNSPWTHCGLRLPSFGKLDKNSRSDSLSQCVCVCVSRFSLSKNSFFSVR